MKNKKCKRFLAFFSAVLLIVALSVPVFALDIVSINDLRSKTIQFNDVLEYDTSNDHTIGVLEGAFESANRTLMMIAIGSSDSLLNISYVFNKDDGLSENILVYKSDIGWVDSSYKILKFSSQDIKRIGTGSDELVVNFFNTNSVDYVPQPDKSEILGHWRFNDKQISSFTSKVSQSFNFENSIDGTKYTSMSVDPTSAPSAEPFSYLFGDTKVYDSVTGWTTPESKYITVTNVDGIKDLNPLLDYLKANAVHSDLPFPPPQKYTGIISGVGDVVDTVISVMVDFASFIVSTPIVMIMAIALPLVHFGSSMLLKIFKRS